MANSLWGSTSATWHLMEKAMLGCSSMLIFDYKGWDACILGGHEFGETMSSAKCPLFSSLLFFKSPMTVSIYGTLFLIPNRFPLNRPAKVAPSHMSLVHPMSQIRPVCLDLSHSKGTCWSRIRASLFAMTGWQLLGFGMAFLVAPVGKC